MAKVHAAKALETMLDQTSERAGMIGRAATQQRVPGLQIVNSASPCWRSDAKMIETTPESEVTPVSPENDCDRNFP
jgi:hypothetical protein